MAGLEGNTDVKNLNTYAGPSTNTNLVYKIPDLMIVGVEGKQFLVNDQLAYVVEAACKEVFGRTGGAGFPILCDAYLGASKMIIVKRGVERAGATAVIYDWGTKWSCSEGEVEEWLRRRSMGKEKRCLIIDEGVSRDWEASHVLVVSSGEGGLENLVMRAVGYCALVKLK